MADIVKRVNRAVPPTQRTQTFTNADAVTGDILKVETSLGHPASYASIQVATGPVRVRLNVYQRVFTNRTLDGLLRPDLPNTASGFDFVDRTGAFIDIEAGTTYELDHVLPIKDIELVTVSGTFDIFVS